jgi:hypothetical protein
MPNGWQYAEAGILKLQLIKPLQFLVNVQNLNLPTSPGLRILRVRHWRLFLQTLYTYSFHSYLILRWSRMG